MATSEQRRPFLPNLPAWPLITVGGLCLGLCTAGAAYLGYGAYLRMSWFFSLPISLCVCVAVLSAFHAVSLWLKRSNLPAHTNPYRGHRFFLTIAVCSCLYCLGWFSGIQARQAKCRRIGKGCEPVIEALESYRSRHGSYPTSLASIPDIETVMQSLPVTVGESNFTSMGLNVGDIARADVTLYLSPDQFVFLVPIEHWFPMSFTRFYVYLRTSKSSEWKKDYIGWHLSPVG